MTETKILFVDDEKNVLKSLQRLLMDDDYDVLTAASGEEGLALLDEHPDVPLVVSDYRMPGMDGVEFLRQAFEKNPDAIRIVLSGYADTASVVSAINDGKIYKFIPKPWNDDELKVTLEKSLEVYSLQRKNKEMAEELSHYNEELKALNSSLESQVEERTANLVFQNKALVFSQNILFSLPIGVFGIDGQGLIVQSNPMADEILSENKTPLVGMDSKNALPESLLTMLSEVKPSVLVNELATIGQNQYWVRITLMNPKGSQFGTIVALVPAGL